MSGAPRLLSLATASPPHQLTQSEAAGKASILFGATHGERLVGVFKNAAIETRQITASVDWLTQPHTFAERNDSFLEAAVAMLEEAAGKALAQAGLSAAEIDTIVTVCSTGIATPALDARLMTRMDFRRDVQRMPIFGLGCAGGVLGLARAAAMAKAAPQSRVLLLVIELCSLTFRVDDRSKSNLVASALFGDGAAAAVIACDADAGPILGAAGEYTWPDSLDVMGWDIAEDGLKVLFSRDIPTLVRDDFTAPLEGFLQSQGLGLADIDGFVCHPGGAKVVDALETVFGLPAGALVHARSVLADHGNMSAVTVLFVLKRTLEAGVRGRLLLTTLGPGFTAGMMLVDAA